MSNKAAQNINLIAEYEPSNIILGKYTKNKHVTYFYPLKNCPDEFSKLRIQLPKMRILWEPEEKRTKDGKLFVKNYTLSLKESGSTSNKRSVSLLKQKMEQTDSIVKNLLPDELKYKTMNATLWQKGDFDPCMKFAINYDFNDETKCNCNVYNNDNVLIHEDELKKGSLIGVILRFEKLWIYNDKVGIQWIADQIKIYDDQPTLKVKEHSSTGTRRFKLRNDD